MRKHERVFQVGSQQRTMEINRFCCEFIRDGKLGKVEQVSGSELRRAEKVHEGLPEEPVPPTDDWNTWCGPTEVRPFNQELQFAWMQWRDYLGRRDDQLGRARCRSNPMGAWQGWHWSD